MGLSKELTEYLKSCGHVEESIKQYHLGTELYHELGIYGEVAYDHLFNLEKSFGVDMSSFVFEVYFPDEFVGKTTVGKVFYWFFPWLWHKNKGRDDYQSLTLGMLEQAILDKKWDCKGLNN